MEAELRPILKWAGGKSKLVPLISEVFASPCTGRYFEPFVGSGAAYFGLRAAGVVGEAVLSDSNAKLVAFHQVVRDRVDDLLVELHLLPKQDWHAEYYAVRGRYNEAEVGSAAHAAMFLWLNFHCFNGLHRENRAGKFNVPVGQYAEPKLPDESRIRGASAALQGASIERSGFGEVISRAGLGDFVYCDPPYVAASATSSFTAYSQGGFSEEDQVSLARSITDSASRGARVVVSNLDCEFVRTKLYPASSGFVLYQVDVKRSISAGKRSSASEVLAVIQGGAT